MGKDISRDKLKIIEALEFMLKVAVMNNSNSIKQYIFNQTDEPRMLLLRQAAAR
jgi:hypothetical protein